MSNKKISKAIIKRLPRYYRYLSELHEKGEDRISSSRLSEIMNLTASQIRRDLSTFGEFGIQGYGYNVKFLKDEIDKVLCINKANHMILIGAGNLGQAIIKYNGFADNGFVFDAIFSHSSEKIGSEIAGIKVQSIAELNDYISENHVDIVVLTVTESVAQDIIDMLAKNYNRGVWNFASTDLESKNGMTIENVHLSESLMRLTYNMNKGN